VIDRPRVGGDDLGVDAEVGQLLLDQARGELQRFDRDGFLHRRRFVQQRQRRQFRVGDVGEQRGLLFLDHAFGRHHGNDLRRDADRFALDVLLDVAGALFLDVLLALDGRDLADLAVFIGAVQAAETLDDDLDEGAGALGHRQPRHLEEQREADREQQQQQQRAAGEAAGGVRAPADQLAEHAARRPRQRRRQAVHAQLFDADAAGHQQREADPADHAF
jgi:hypothetical protein